MSKYVISLILLNLVQIYAQITNDTVSIVKKEHGFVRNLIHEAVHALINGTAGLQTAIDFPGDIKVTSVIKFCSNKNVHSTSTDVVEENIKTETTTNVDNLNYIDFNDTITNDNIDNNLEEQNIDYKNKHVENGADNQTAQTNSNSSEVSINDRFDQMGQNVTKPSLNETELSLPEAWRRFSETFKTFLTTRDLEVIFPDNYLFNEQALRVSLQNFLNHGSMVEFRLIKRKKPIYADDKIDKVPKEELDLGAELKFKQFMDVVLAIFSNIIFGAVFLVKVVTYLPGYFISLIPLSSPLRTFAACFMSSAGSILQKLSWTVTMDIDETENVDNVILSRISLREISVLSEDDPDDQTLKKSPLTNDERKWRLSYLRNQFASYELQDLFKVYTKKVNHGYFSLFLILQCLLSITHSAFVINSNQDDLLIVLPDIVLYIATIVLSLLCLYTVDTVAEKYKKLQYVALLAFGVIFFVNGFIPYYHRHTGKYRPAYSPYLVVACYLFFAVENLKIATLMGVSVSVFHIVTLFFVTYSNDSFLWKKIASDAIFATFMNCLGIYYRFMNEIVIRRSFLDRRDCIMSTFQLKHEKTQVEQLMQSIIPRYVMNKVKERYIEATKSFIETGKYLKKNPFDNSLLDEHENVTILFADIVNYTEMTSKLKITELLETLNDLFGLFDESSNKLNVTRIKFLGDCYYCVAGLPPVSAENPAEACVDLGLEMISIIAAVRIKRNLNINMRIGVHSGRIISGIIGSVKYQFDIWSKDVDIANKMESEGKPGMVHITNTTKDLLKKCYNITPTNKGDTVFKHCGIQTYLIKPNVEKDNLPTPTSESAPSSPTNRPSIFKKQKSIPNSLPLLAQLQRAPSLLEEEPKKVASSTFIEDNNRYRNSDDRLYRKSRNSSNYNLRSLDFRRSTSTWKRRTAFMNNNIKRYSERTIEVNKEMEKTIDLISFSKYEQYVKSKDINVLLLFNNLKTELEYLKIPDALFKYYLLSAAMLILCVYFIQNLTLKRWDMTTWPFLATTLPILFILVPISWAEYLYNKYVASYTNETPSNLAMRLICRASTVMTNSFSVRLIVFLLIYFCFSACALGEMIDCRNNVDSEIHFNSTRMSLFSLLMNSEAHNRAMLHCVLPWHMTETCLMTVIMTFLFLRIFIWIKLVLGTVTISLYGYCVLSFSKGYYKDSETFNHLLKPQVAHIMSTIFLIVTLHLVDRQTDYMNRLDYLLNRKFKSEQEEANLLQRVNENLLVNILPKHVANLYLDVSREQMELYFEEHNNVAVMFASIITDNELQDILDEKEFLFLMNTYITSFDILTNRKEFHNIEKIKVAKWTYMVACGLFPGGRQGEVERHQTSSSIGTLLSFASEMFKKLNQVNRNHQQKSRLRIGISHGKIAAGVVGSKKPLYDIWGDPVNMASRMDSTGVPDRIQVMERTAEIIQKLGYKCTERGNIQVKGKHGLVKTYFVDIDENFNLVRGGFRTNGVNF